MAALLAPCFLREAATGITPQEHRGSGIPNSEAFSSEEKRFFPRCFSTNCGESQTERIPAMRKPKSR